MMLDSESLAKSALNGYSIYKTGSCKKAFFQGITKSKEITSISNVKCFKPIFDESLRNPTVISFINGQQIKDLHLVSKRNSLKVSPAKISNNSSSASYQNDMRKPVTDVNIPCKCPKESQKVKTKQTNGISEKKQKKNNGLQQTNKNLDHNFRKRCNTLNNSDIHEEPKEYVYKSSQRIQMLVNRREPSTQINNQLLEKMLGSPDQLIEIEKKRNSQYSKKAKCSANDKQTKINSNSNETKSLGGSTMTNSTLLARCEWFDCTSSYESVEELTNHVKLSHLEKLMSNDQFVCLWRDCKFSNQPSCSFKWLSKHVMRHCDLKPFKCVILGCDMTFSTQNGLARHVPTHFNESRVRRACVLTSETSKKEVIRPRRSLSTTLSSCSESSSIFSESNKLDKEEDEERESTTDGFIRSSSVVRNLNVERSKKTFFFSFNLVN